MDRAAAYRADRTDILALLKDLSPDEWAKPSRCDGWTVQDVVAHMSAACHGTFGPWVVKLIAGKDVEAGNDRDAAKRKSWAPAKVLQEYEVWSGRLAAIQPLLQKAPLKSLPIRVSEVGVYPAKLLTSAFVFDHGLHARYDIAAALGRSMPKPDANRVAVANEWMLAGIGAMSGDRLNWLDRKVQLVLTGPGGSTYTVEHGKKKVVAAAGGAPDAAVTVEGPAESFPEWGTGRESWRKLEVTCTGDEALGTRFLDTMRII
ncbi:MAG: maleylpyruvate isomerase family mycothiol-dependent enzyme [Sporichthyaceae bacterium]